MTTQVRCTPSVVGDTRCKRCNRLVTGVSGFFASHVGVLPTWVNVTYSGHHAPQLYGNHESGRIFQPGEWPLPVTIDRYCAKCVQVNQSGLFYSREDWIRESLLEGINLGDALPSSDAPSTVIADWLAEQNRLKDAQYMRSLCSD